VGVPRAEQHRGGQLNAAAAEQLRLLDLQALDSRLDQLAHRRRTLPELAEIRTLESRLATVRDLIVAGETEASDLAREQAKADADVEQVRARAARDQQRLDSGQVSSPRELESLQHEIASLARRQSDLEDVELEVMERLETVQRRSAELRTELVALESQLQTQTARRDTVFAAIDAESENVAGERSALAGRLPAELIALYEKLRAQHDGVGAAALHQRRCEGCRLELNNTELSRIHHAPDDAVLRCEECRRILVRTPESGL